MGQAVDPEERESRAMFDAPFRALIGAVTPQESKRIKADLGYDIPAGMGKQAAVSRGMKQRDIEIARVKAFGQQEAQLKVPDKPSQTERKVITDELAALGRVMSMHENYNPDWVGPVRGRIGSAGEVVGGISPEEADFRAQVTTMKNETIKFITGAQLSEPESKRILGQVPSTENPPPVFEARMKRTQYNLLMLAHIHREVLQASGVETKDLLRLPPIPHDLEKEYLQLRGASNALVAPPKPSKPMSSNDINKTLDTILQELRNTKK